MNNIAAILGPFSFEPSLFPNDLFPENVEVNSFKERVLDDFSHYVIERSICDINGMLKVADDLSEG